MKPIEEIFDREYYKTKYEETQKQLTIIQIAYAVLDKAFLMALNNSPSCMQVWIDKVIKGDKE